VVKKTAPQRTTTARAKMAITIPQLSWNQVRPAPIVLISGSESFLANRATVMLRDFLRSEDPSLEVKDIMAESYVPGEIMTFASPSLFNEPRLIRVENVEKCTDAFIVEMLEYLSSPAHGTYIVLKHGGGVRAKKLLEEVRCTDGIAVEIVCAPLKRDTDKYDFAAAEFSMAQRTATPTALRALVCAFSHDIAELAAACQQLIADTTEHITPSTVDRYYAGRSETNAFTVADAAIAGRYGDALLALRHALASGADPVPIVAAFATKIRTMAKLYGARGSANTLASEYGLAPWQVERARRDSQGWSDPGLRHCIAVLAETDAKIKGAGRDPVFALERLVSIVSSRGVADC
jgi:DNA polymerase-3 subunit delta